MGNSKQSVRTCSVFTRVDHYERLFAGFKKRGLTTKLSLRRRGIRIFQGQVGRLTSLARSSLRVGISVSVQLPFPCVGRRLVRRLGVLRPFKGNGKGPLFTRDGLHMVRPEVFKGGQGILGYELRSRRKGRVRTICFKRIRSYLRRVRGGRVVSFACCPSVGRCVKQEAVRLAVIGCR